MKDKVEDRDNEKGSNKITYQLNDSKSPRRDDFERKERKDKKNYKMSDRYRLHDDIVADVSDDDSRLKFPALKVKGHQTLESNLASGSLDHKDYDQSDKNDHEHSYENGQRDDERFVRKKMETLTLPSDDSYSNGVSEKRSKHSGPQYEDDHEHHVSTGDRTPKVKEQKTSSGKVFCFSSYSFCVRFYCMSYLHPFANGV